MQEWTEEKIEARAREIAARSGRPRRRERLRVAEGLREAPRHDIETQDGPVAAWRVGQGPAVMLVHGWEDDNSLWTPLIDRLRREDRAVVAVDLPAHGHSRADTPGVPNAAEAVLAVSQALGPVKVIVGHSFGVSASMLALSRGLAARGAVLIAPALPSRPDLIKRRTMPARRMDDAPPEHVQHLLEARVRALMAERNNPERRRAEFDAEKIAAQMRGRALFVHCRDDEMWPPEASQYIAAQWQGAEIHFTHGLGHRPVARDSAVIDRILTFVREFDDER